MRIAFALVPALLFAAACESDRSTGGGGVRGGGGSDNGIPNPTGDTGGGRDGGGGSGVDSNKYLDELNATELMALCEWMTAQQGGAGTKQCTEGLSITVDTVQECVTDGSAMAPHCQVSLTEACMTSLAGDACKILETPECGALFACVLGGGGEDAGEADAAELPG